MLEESVTNQEQVLVLSWEPALVNDEVALIMTGVIQILLGVDLEHVVGHLEANWLDLGRDGLALIVDMAEGLVAGAVKVWKGSGPLCSNFFENIGWNGELGGTSVDDGWIGSVFAWLLHRFLTVVHALTLESPGS